MNSYDHPQPYPRPQGTGYDEYDEYGGYEDAYARRDAYTRDSYGTDPYPADPYAGSAPAQDRAAPPARAAASVGAASAGRASVPAPTDYHAPGYGPAEQARPRYDWSSGSPAVAGRATVPVSPGPGGGATGRASVPPGGGGPGGTGPGNGRPGGSGGPAPARKKNRHWLRNSLLSALALLIIATGGGMVALSYYVESVPPPQELDLEEASTIFYADGSEMAVLQEVNREIIDTKIPELAHVRDAVVAAEDNDFYDHSGVDFVGIVRAAVNNARGGERQGASTIDQQYARRAADIFEDSYSRKLQEAAMAYKMNQDHTKLEILDFYLNTIYFGRGAHGIQAAAQAYFGKDAIDLDVSEAAVLAGVIRIPDDGSGLSPYDPLYNPENPQIAVARWNYVLTNMVGIGAVTPAERAEFVDLPEAIDPKTNQDWHEGPQGNIVRQVRREIEAMGIEDLATGGYRITTTIDPAVQKAALKAARRKSKGPLWEEIPKNIDAAIVAINPENGAVLAYYGGEDGTGFDLAGKNWSEERGWHGGRPPGSSFKIYALVAALREGVSLESHWKTSEYEPDWMAEKVRNAGRVATSCDGHAPDYCTLRWSTEHSYNVPFAYFSEAVSGGQGPAKITQAAMDAGIKMMTDTQEGVAHDLTAISNASEVAPEHFFHPVAYGQYPVTVLDHASGVATLAARGVYYKPHFVAKVEQRIDGEYVPIASDRISGEQRIDVAHADAVTGALAPIAGLTGVPLEGGRPSATKTGTWEHRDGGNADAWMVGYTPQIAAAVWVGDAKGDQIRDQWGNNIGSSGLPSYIWKQFMDAAHAAKEYQHAQFPAAPPVGSPQHPYANGELPAPEERRPGHPRCALPFVSCPEPPDDDDDDDDDDDGNGGGLLPLPPVEPPGEDENP